MSCWPVRQTAIYAAYRKAIPGFRTAFPEEISEPDVASATQKATDMCVDALLVNLVEGNPAERDQLRAELESCVREALKTAVAV